MSDNRPPPGSSKNVSHSSVVHLEIQHGIVVQGAHLDARPILEHESDAAAIEESECSRREEMRHPEDIAIEALGFSDVPDSSSL
jgi:hypothetical protein